MIVFIHLLNDRSGSPNVLKQVADVIGNLEDGSCLYVGSDGRGVLEDCALPIRRYWYWRTRWRLFTLVTYSLSQIILFFQLLCDRSITKKAVIYVNTLLPFGASLFGRLTGRRVVYHLHEVSVSPIPLRYWLVWLASITANDLVYVSRFHRRRLPIHGVSFQVIPNALPATFCNQANNSDYRPHRNGLFSVLMLTSLRDYKGVPEFIALAERFEARDDLHFELIANDNEDAIVHYFDKRFLPSNLSVHSRTPNPALFYSRASLVVNLSRPDLWLETFGLTLVEAMAFGIPVIAPPVGGPVEIVEHGVHGYLVDCRDSEVLYSTVLKLVESHALCFRLSVAARTRAQEYSTGEFSRKLKNLIEATPSAGL